MTGLADALARENLPDSHDDNPRIQPERLVIHVPHIEREFLFPRDCVAPVHLRPTGDAGSDFVAARLFTRLFRAPA